jgi:hypothetical protein
MNTAAINSRRGFLLGLGSLLAAPAVVRVSSLMPIRGEPLWVPTNSLLTINMITREAVKLWNNSNKFIQVIDRQYSELESGTGYRVGDTLRIALPRDYNEYRVG